MATCHRCNKDTSYGRFCPARKHILCDTCYQGGICPLCEAEAAKTVQVQPTVVATQQVQQTVLCPRCNAMNQLGVKFCGACGNSMQAMPVIQQPFYPPVQQPTYTTEKIVGVVVGALFGLLAVIIALLMLLSQNENTRVTAKSMLVGAAVWFLIVIFLVLVIGGNGGYAEAVTGLPLS